PPSARSREPAVHPASSTPGTVAVPVRSTPRTAVVRTNRSQSPRASNFGGEVLGSRRRRRSRRRRLAPAAQELLELLQRLQVLGDLGEAGERLLERDVLADARLR